MKTNLLSIKKLYLFVIVSGLIILQGTAHASYFDSFTSSNYLNYATRNVNLNGDGERVSFTVQDDWILRMKSRDGKNDYFSFMSYYGDRYLDYSITKLQLRDPKKIFFEINMMAGAHAKNSGYWIIGKYGNKWVTFVSLDSLAAVGYKPNEWHSIRTKVNENGELILTSRNGTGIDFQAKLFWDSNAQWFGIKRIK